jgi:hypothetical protein
MSLNRGYITEKDSVPNDATKSTYLFYYKMEKWIRDLLSNAESNQYKITFDHSKAIATLTYELLGPKITFNLDGTPFHFQGNFHLIIEFSGKYNLL